MSGKEGWGNLKNKKLNNKFKKNKLKKEKNLFIRSYVNILNNNVITKKTTKIQNTSLAISALNQANPRAPNAYATTAIIKKTTANHIKSIMCATPCSCITKYGPVFTFNKIRELGLRFRLKKWL